MKKLQDLQIKQKLMLVILITCASVLLLASLSLIIYQMYDYRKTIVRDMTVMANILARNTRAAIVFQDENEGYKKLSSFEFDPRVMAASIFNKDGNQFVKYVRSGMKVLLPDHPESDGYRFTHNSLVVVRPVFQNEKRIGTIYLQAGLEQMYAELHLFAVISGLVLLGSILTAFLMSSWLQQFISGPILSLTAIARKVGKHGDYTVRAKKPAGDEVGELAVSFNEMLDQIQLQDSSLRESEALHRTVVDNLDEGVVVSDLDGRLLHFNSAAIEMHGFSSPDEYHRRLPEFADTFELATIDGEYLPVDEWPLTHVLRGEHLHDLEINIRNIREDWKKIFSYSGSLVRDMDEKPLMAILTIRDITERKLSQQRIDAQLVRLELLQQITRVIGDRLDLSSIFQVVIGNLEVHMPIDFGCVCLYDHADHHVTVTSIGYDSQRLAAVMDLEPGQVIPIDTNGLSRCIYGQLVYEPDISQVDFPFSKRMASAGIRSLVIAPLQVESKIFGVLFAARCHAHSFSSTDCEFLNQLSGHVALAANQSQLYNALQQAYDDLRQTQQAIMQQERLRALGQMASGIAHDINNAISPVALYTESLLETEPNLSRKSRDYLETIQRAVEDVAHTVSRMREFYRQREPQMTLTPVSLNQIVEQVKELTRVRWSDMPQQQGFVIELNMDLAPDLPVIMGVESEIREALTNLIFNAIDAMPEGGTLTLRTRKVGSNTDADNVVRPTSVVIEVSDSGTGMDENTKRQCLEPFYTTKGERGTGLGMAMVYGILQRHSADIEIDSVKDEGTTVRLIFTVSTVIMQEPADNIRISLSRLRLLVIDDDPLLIKSLRDILETDGHDVTVATGGQQGIEYFRSAYEQGIPFAAVITDLGMPYIDGRKVAEAIKAISASTPVILLTGWGQRLKAEGDVPEHVNCILNKPPRLNEIRMTLAKYCQKN